MIQEIQINPDLSIPVLGEKSFCSRRDPIREAAAWFKSHQDAIMKSEKVLIFGVGAGFHLHFIPRNKKVFYFDIHPDLSLRYQFKFPDSPAKSLAKIEDYIESSLFHFRPAQTGNEKFYEILAKKEALNIKMVVELLKAAPGDDFDAKVWRSLVEMVQ